MIEIFQIAAFVLFNGVILLFGAGAIYMARARHEAAAVAGTAGNTAAERRILTTAGDRAPNRPMRTGVRPDVRNGRTAR